MPGAPVPASSVLPLAEVTTEVADLNGVYAEHQDICRTISTSQDVLLNVYLDAAAAGEQAAASSEICVFSQQLRALYNPNLLAWNVLLHGLSLGLSPTAREATIRVTCEFLPPTIGGTTIMGSFRVGQNLDLFTIFDRRTTKLFVHVAQGFLLSMFLRFSGQEVLMNHFTPQFAPMATPSTNPPPPRAVDFAGTSATSAKQSPPVINNKRPPPPTAFVQPPPPPPLSLHLLPDNFEDEVMRDPWRLLVANGAIFTDRLERSTPSSRPPYLGRMVVDSVLNKRILTNMFRNPSMRPSILTLVEEARKLGMHVPLFASIDYAELAVTDDDQAAFAFLLDEFLSKFTEIGQLLPIRLTSDLVAQERNNSTLLENLKRCYDSTLDDDVLHSLLAQILLSPVHLLEMGSTPDGSAFLSYISAGKRPTLVADFARTFGFGRKRLFVGLGTNEHGWKVVKQVIANCLKDNLEPLFDFREALNECVCRLAVHPLGASVIGEALDHPFFRASVVLRLFGKNQQDLLPRAVPLLVRCIQSEPDQSRKQLCIDSVLRHAPLLAGEERSQFESLQQTR